MNGTVVYITKAGTRISMTCEVPARLTKKQREKVERILRDAETAR